MGMITKELTGTLADIFDEYKEQINVAVSLSGINLDSTILVMFFRTNRPCISGCVVY